jgi:CO/xanthine dehydrogenase FAD-binding subunit
VKALSGSPPATLTTMQRSVARILTLASGIAPPEEMAAAHALLISATQLAGNAAQIRREATLAGDMARAWDASSAAAGALMLGAKARTDIQTLLRPPQLR